MFFSLEKRDRTWHFFQHRSFFEGGKGGDQQKKKSLLLRQDVKTGRGGGGIICTEEKKRRLIDCELNLSVLYGYYTILYYMGNDRVCVSLLTTQSHLFFLFFLPFLRGLFLPPIADQRIPLPLPSKIYVLSLPFSFCCCHQLNLCPPGRRG